jgi:Spy/CpxP family protein refolding chaperone
MKNNRRISNSIILALLLAICIPLSAHANDKKKGHRLDMRVTKMQQKLELSDKQADSVYDILKAAKSGEKCNGETFSERKNCRLEKRAATSAKIIEFEFRSLA